MLTGTYTEEEFHQSIEHLSALRTKHPKVGLDTVTIPYPTPPHVEAKLNKMFESFVGTVVQVPLRDFIHHDINSLSNLIV
jgi:hypothetical protein